MKTFIFDFDSTLFPGETLDEIINLSLKNNPQQDLKSQQISRICAQGMNGEISSRESLAKRLAICSPTKKIIEKYIKQNQRRIDVKIRGILEKLSESGHQVLVVSGGFREWIVPLLESLVPAKNIYSNGIKDLDQPMSFKNIMVYDKEELVQNLKLNSREIYMIGDGMTDLRVFESGIANRFIGAGFYAFRKRVCQRSLAYQQLFFEDLDKFVEHLLNKCHIENRSEMA